MKNFTLIFSAMLLLIGTAFAQQTKNITKSDQSHEVQIYHLKEIPSEFVQPSTTETTNFIKGLNSDVYYGSGTPTNIHKATLSSFPGTQLGLSNTHIQASEYINGTLYGVTYSNGNAFGTINQSTGVFTAINSNFPCDAVSLCYNPTNGLTYVFSWGGGSFGTVDLSTGSYSHIANISSGNEGTLFAAIDNNGICYAMRNTSDKFGTVNLATGEFTLIANMTFSCNAIQEMSIDRETNELYWQSNTGTYTCVIYKINKTTGALTTVSNLSVSASPTLFSIATDAPANCDPISNLSVTAAGSTVQLTWTAAPGSPTSYKIECDGIEIANITETSYTHNDVPYGLHTYTVTALFGGSCIPFGISENIIIGDMCILRIEMQDVEADGWDGSHIVVASNGVTYGTATVPYDAPLAVSFIVVPSGLLEFSWVLGEEELGAYDYECSFQIYNSDDEMIYECVEGLAIDFDGVFYTYNNNCGNVTTPPGKPENLQITRTGCNFTMAWTAPQGATNPVYNIYKDGALVAENHNSTTYTFSLNEGEVFNWCIETLASGMTSDEQACATNSGCTSGIHGSAFENVVLAPNPASTTVKISGDITKVEIYNTLGQLVDTHTNNFYEINVSGFDDGVYLFKLFNANNETSTRQIVICR